jgi:hypothetical protein
VGVEACSREVTMLEEVIGAVAMLVEDVDAAGAEAAE